LEGIIGQGRDAGEVRQGVNPERSAMHVLSLMQGASLAAWGLKQVPSSRFSITS
jgi:hypothetical protein